MKRIINKKTYNTETAILIVETDNGRGRSDFNGIEETLYQTKKGTFFLEYWGGAATGYSKSGGNWSSEGRGIKVLSDDEAYEFLERHNQTDAIEKYFSDVIEEG